MQNRNFSAAGRHVGAAPPFFGRAFAAAALLAVFAVATGAGAIRCPVAHFFHYPCPACGSKRSVMGLLTGHFDRVVNPLAPIAAVLLAVVAVRVVLLVAQTGDVRTLGQGAFGRALTRALFVVAMLEILLWIARAFGFFGGPVAISGY